MQHEQRGNFCHPLFYPLLDLITKSSEGLRNYLRRISGWMRCIYQRYKSDSELIKRNGMKGRKLKNLMWQPNCRLFISAPEIPFKFLHWGIWRHYYYPIQNLSHPSFQHGQTFALIYTPGFDQHPRLRACFDGSLCITRRLLLTGFNSE